MSVPQELPELVERFHANREAYRSGQYNETQLRREFIDPLFQFLGWDVNNEKGYAEAYKDVIHEDSIKIGGLTKAPDYCFRIGGVRKFFVETKRPSVNIKEDIDPAFQLRRYAWSAKLPLSILTDFEEFAVYDCRVKPNKTDKASTARIIYVGNCAEFTRNWDEIVSVFSREAVLKGSFDRYAESSRAKKGTAEVDRAFLMEIESWRDALARNLALRNPDLSQRDLNFSVQRIIDRIIFLRICEDRGIERYGQLMVLQNGDRMYKRLCELFYRADERYNSGLFHFQKEKDRFESPDTLTPNLNIDDGALRDIIKNLYYPDSPYEFSVLSADILGQVYEQFLGKVIRLTVSHRAVVEEKPEVRKSGGIYYTPTYIVDYIVKNTVGKLLGNELQNSERMKIPLSKGGKGVVNSEIQNLSSTQIGDPNSQSGNWRLTTAERRRILLNNIYGVDIDQQAVEVTKLSLLLKVLEGESEQTIVKQLKMFHERALPDLSNNIKCGNSLIGTDFYNTNVGAGLKPAPTVGDEERRKVNPFDWETEFPEIMKTGGFDAVIGNPPYVRQEGLGDLKEYFQQKYTVYHGMADLYAYFIEKGVSLLRDKGIFGYIVANKWMRANYGEPLRKWLKRQCIVQIVDFGDLPVFQQATTYPCILVIGKDKPPSAFIATPAGSGLQPEPNILVQSKTAEPARSAKKPAITFSVTHVKTLEFESLASYVKENRHSVKLSILDDTGWSLADERSAALLNKLKKTGVPLKEYVKGKIYRGVLTGLNEAFVIDEKTRHRLISEDPKSKEIIKPFLVGRDVKRYQPPTGNQFLIFIPKGWTSANFGNASDMWNCFQKKYPAVARHLLPFADNAKKRYDKGDYWWELRACEYYAEFEKPKIVYPNICKKSEFVFDEEGFYTNQKCFIISLPDKYLLGLLNSTVNNFLFRSILPKLRGDFYEPSYVFFKDFPIHVIDFSNTTDKARYDQMVALVDQMLDLHKQLASAKTDHDKTVIQRQIDATDRQIDQLVYELYGLTKEEIKIVEKEIQ